MRIEDDICLADAPDPILRVLEARPLDADRMEFLFSNGERRIWNRATLRGSAFLPLRTERVFRAVELFHGIPTWDSGNIDIAPEWLWQTSDPLSPSIN